MTRFLAAISILLFAGVFVARGQESAPDPLSNADKADIIESVLDLERKNQGSISVFGISINRENFPGIRALSSENIEFLDPSRVSKYGFTLVPAGQLREAKRENIVQYFVFKRIFLRNGAAKVFLSSVIEGRPCFGEHFSTTVDYIYESRQTPVGWIATSFVNPSPLFPYAAKRLAIRR